MAFTWANTFVPPNAVSGFSSGAVTDIDEWPFNATDVLVRSHTGGASHTNLTFTFDMSAGPGDKKGFWVWMSMRVSNANGVRFDAYRLVDTSGTPTTLYTNSSPGITVVETTGGSSKIYVLEIPDSAFAGNPNINSLALQVDTTNLNGGNNNFIIHGVRMMKSPFTAAQQAVLPASLSGADFSCYRSSDLVALGAANSEEIVVWPDASGRGRHLVRVGGSGRPILATGTPDTVEFDDGTPSRLIAHFGTRVTGNHIHHDYLRSDDTPGSAQAIWDGAEDFKGVVTTDKNILGTQSGPEWVLMSGDGSGGAHIGWGTYTTSLVRLTQWVQDSGNEHGWVNDNATPAADAAGSNSSNDMVALSYGTRQTNDRAWDGGVVEHWWINGAGITEADIDDARDEWVNGPGGTAHTATRTEPVGVTDTTTPAAAKVRVIADPVGVSDTTNRVIETVRPISEPVGVTDSPTTTKTIPVSATNTVGVTDLVTPHKTVPVPVTDQVGVTDTTTRVHAAIRANVEAVAVSDSVSDNENNRTTLTEPVTTTDTTARAHTAVRAVTDPAGITDTVTPVVESAVVAAVTDPVGVTDLVGAVLEVAATETVTDSVGVTDTVTAARAVHVPVVEPVGTEDSTDRIHTAARTHSDPVGVTGLVAEVVQGAGTATTTDSVGVADTTVRVHTADRVVVDPVGVTTTILPAKSVTVAITDTVSVEDTVTATNGIAVQIVDTTDVADTTTRVHTVVRVITDPVAVIDQASTPTSYQRTVTDNVGVTDFVATNFVLDGTPWWAPNPAGHTPDPVGVVAAPVSYVPATPDKNPPL